ncbi:DUF4143 domain-containing protein [Variovorax saccharolyticus]|uniref:DUF4143 domain-containing protein n=1 Tax=Variovorax saccharolyticus TaxID=3053516 RepID=UPI004037FADE
MHKAGVSQTCSQTKRLQANAPSRTKSTTTPCRVQARGLESPAFLSSRSCAPAPGQSLPQTLLTGIFPRLHDQSLDPSQALGDYFATYVGRDLRQLAAVHDLQRFERFVRLCGGRVGQLVNLTSLGNEAGHSHATAPAWLDLLHTSYIVQVPPPWFTNTSKRLEPKVFLYDVGLACWFVGVAQRRTGGARPG